MDALLAKSKVFDDVIAATPNADDLVYEKNKFIEAFVEKFGELTLDDCAFFEGTVSNVSTRLLEIYQYLCLDDQTLINKLVAWMLDNYSIIVERKIDRYLDICIQIEETSCAFRRIGRCEDMTDAIISGHRHCQTKMHNAGRRTCSLKKYGERIVTTTGDTCHTEEHITVSYFDGISTENIYILHPKPTFKLIAKVIDTGCQSIYGYMLTYPSFVFSRRAIKWPSIHTIIKYLTGVNSDVDEIIIDGESVDTSDTNIRIYIDGTSRHFLKIGYCHEGEMSIDITRYAFGHDELPDMIQLYLTDSDLRLTPIDGARRFDISTSAPFEPIEVFF